MDSSRYSNKLRDIVRLRQILKKWKMVPKGYVTVHVGKDLKRFVIPTEYLSHQAFGILLREAEEEYGFRHDGVLKFPCEVDLFEKILKMMGDKKIGLVLHDRSRAFTTTCGKRYSSNNSDLTPCSPRPKMCT